MATKTSFHTRSISLPSTSNPINENIENHFRRLRASQAGPSSSSSLCQNLCNVKDLYEQMNQLIHLPHNVQVLSNEHLRAEVEEVLDGSLALLDTSSFALDALSQMKESVFDLKSALRRGSDNEGIHEFMTSRKKINKALSKCLVNLKKAEQICAPKETDGSVVGLLKESEAISLATLKSILLYVMGKKASQPCGWSLVNKLVKSKKLSSVLEIPSEVENLDLVLAKIDDSKVVMKHLEIIEKIIFDLEDGLNSVSRCFVKVRVSLLNVLNH